MTNLRGGGNHARCRKSRGLTLGVYNVAGSSEVSRSRLSGSIAGRQAVLWRLAEGVKLIKQDTVPVNLAR